MASEPCPVDQCPRTTYRGGYCYGHYMKNWRYGTPTPTHPPRYEDISGQRFGTLIAVVFTGNWWHCTCDCGAERKVRTSELKRTGDGNTCGLPGRHLNTTVGYGTAHTRVRTQRGPSTDYLCIDCGKQAQQWSYDHADPNELISETRGTEGIAYSTDPDRYDPRCISCHKRFDLKRIGSTYGERRRLSLPK